MDNITFLLALWGAFLSTYLALREVRKNSRQLRLLLEHDTWAGSYRLVIVNSGHRPITIEQVNLEVRYKWPGGIVDAIPRIAFWDGDHDPPKLPKTLEDGEMDILYISRDIGSHINNPKKYLKVNVFDAEGNVYSKYTKGVYDQKYGYRAGEYKRPGFIKTAIVTFQHWWVNRR